MLPLLGMEAGSSNYKQEGAQEGEKQFSIAPSSPLWAYGGCPECDASCVAIWKPVGVPIISVCGGVSIVMVSG